MLLCLALCLRSDQRRLPPFLKDKTFFATAFSSIIAHRSEHSGSYKYWYFRMFVLPFVGVGVGVGVVINSIRIGERCDTYVAVRSTTTKLANRPGSVTKNEHLVTKNEHLANVH